MRPSSLVALLCASITSATVELSPEQSSAVESAASAYVASVALQPIFTSIVSELAQATGAALSGVLGIQSFINGATPTGGLDQLNSYIAELPSAASSFFASITAAEASLVEALVATMTTAASTSSSTGSSSSSLVPSKWSGNGTTSASSSSWTGYANSTSTTSSGNVKTLTAVTTVSGKASSTGTAAASSSLSKGAAATAGVKVGGVLMLGAAAVVALL